MGVDEDLEDELVWEVVYGFDIVCFEVILVMCCDWD